MQGDGAPLLEIRGLKTHFTTDDGMVQAVDGVDLSIERGETLGVVGESGCGKTVTAHVGAEADRRCRRAASSPAQILWQGRDLVPLDADEMDAHPRQGDRDGLPGADDLAQPGLHGRRADRRGACASTRASSRKAALDKTVEMLRLVQHPQPAAARATTIRTSSPAACASA